MRRFFLTLAAIFTIAAVTACVPIQPDEVDISGSGDDPAARGEADKLSLPRNSDQSLVSLNRLECDKLAGRYLPSGLAGSYMCILRFSDAGKICRKASDCIGECRTSDGVEPPPNGRCQETTNPFGCYGMIDENGKASPTLCKD